MLQNLTDARALTYKAGYTNHTQHITVTTTANNGKFESVLTQWNGSSVSVLTCWMFESDTFPTSAAVSNLYTAYGDGGDQSINCSTAQTSWWLDGIDDNKKLDITNKDSANNNLTNSYNALFGESLTNAQLYAKLKQLYPGYNSFGWRGSYGSPTSIFCPLSLNYRYEYTGSDPTLALSKCANGTKVISIPSNTTLDGYDYNAGDLTEQLTNDNRVVAYLFAAPRPVNLKCVVDCYFNGTKEPNISMSWKSYDGAIPDEDNTDIIASNLHIVNYAPWEIQQPPFSAYYTYIDSADNIRKMNDLVFNNSNKLRYIKPVAPNDKINTTYLSQVNGIIGTMNTAERIAKYGLDGIPKKLVWYFQVVDGEGNMSSLWELVTPQESEGNLQGYILTELTDAEWPDRKVALFVNIHYGVNQDDITDDDTTPPPPPPQPDPVDWDDDEGHGFPGDAVLTKTYSMPKAILQNIGQKLWSQSYFDVLKIQNNPIQNVVSVKWFPFNLNTGTDENVKVGDIDFGIPGKRINTVKEIDIGSVTYSGVYGNFLDGSPYTNLKLNLPYVGQIQLDASEFLGCSIGVKYIVDLVTGECVARVKRNGIPLYDFPGHMGVDIVLTSSDRVQADMKALQSGIHTAANVTGELITGDVVGATAGAASGAMNIAGMDYNSQRVGSPSGVCGSFQNHKIWLTVSYPKYYQSEGFTHIIGRPCNKYLTLSKFSSGDFVQIDKRSDLKIAMTSEENAELERLLTEGVYI